MLLWQFQGWSSKDRESELALTNRELESARPQTVGEEELQLQLALAMSREEHEQEEQKKRSDEVRLQLALSQSEQDFKKNTHPAAPASHMLDLLDVSLGEPAPVPMPDPWSIPQPGQHKKPADPWAPQVWLTKKKNRDHKL